MTLEDQVRDALDDLVTRVPPRAGLADAVLRQAHRRQTVVRLAAAGGTAVAVAAGTVFVIADPLGSSGPDLGTVGPAAGEPAGESDGEPGTGPVTVDIDAARMVEGAAPAVPWYQDGVLHAGDQEIPFADDVSGFRSILEVAGGLAVLTVPPVEDSEDQDHDGFELLLLSDDGGRTVLGSGAIYDVAVSADGVRIAWAEHDWSTETALSGPGRSRLYVADAATGEVLHEREQTGDAGSMGVAKGFLADGRVVLDNATNGPEGIALWDPAADTVTPWTGYGFTNAVSPAGDLAVVSPRNEVADRSPAVVDAAGAVLWALTVDHFIGRQAFSPDGALVAVVAAPGLSEQARALEDMPSSEPLTVDVPRSIEVRDARTGEPLLVIDGAEPGTLVWETDRTFVVEAWNEDTTAAGLVRCTLDGACELAAPIQDLTGGRIPYLGGSG